jgi:hypothetical protein
MCFFLLILLISCANYPATTAAKPETADEVVLKQAKALALAGIALENKILAKIYAVARVQESDLGAAFIQSIPVKEVRSIICDYTLLDPKRIACLVFGTCNRDVGDTRSSMTKWLMDHWANRKLFDHSMSKVYECGQRAGADPSDVRLAGITWRASSDYASYCTECKKIIVRSSGWLHGQYCHHPGCKIVADLPCVRYEDIPKDLTAAKHHLARYVSQYSGDLERFVNGLDWYRAIEHDLVGVFPAFMPATTAGPASSALCVVL